ncbi:uncharacterized protein LOC127807282 [Diospyros lotus]|uniref:uncharacterized protein LOC127807282 n=1 Tax=Diospyros lotus TaxID=55363 RepID=UPI0022554852|nr:uncharacterized protein LOC127807282 [Diospyros lotus]
MDDNPSEFSTSSTKFLPQGTNFFWKTLSHLSSNPLFSILVTVYALVFLYFPGHLLRVVFSPVLISTGTLLLTLLRLGANQTAENESMINSAEPEPTPSDHLDSADDQDCKWVSSKTNVESRSDMGFCLELDLDPEPGPFYAESSFVEWNVGAPLEVIYELEYEGEEEEQNDDVPAGNQDTRPSSMERYPSLSLYYPETDSDTSSDGGFPDAGGWNTLEGICIRWDEEDREGLIEITLDGKRRSEQFHFEEENLIEIDISPARIREFAGEKVNFPATLGLI